MMKLLVHACCGPCSIMPTRLLAEQGHDITVFYANSNIAPRAEYEKRLAELERYGAAQGFEVIEGVYDPDAWEREVAPIAERIASTSPLPALNAARHAGTDDDAFAGIETVAQLLDDENRKERCRACYRLRLAEAADYAVRNGFEGLATTLAVSPYQFTDVIAEEVQRAADNAGITCCHQDFRPYYDEATRISRELGMYRQNYCGCRYSVAEGEATRAFVKHQRAQTKAARREARAEDDAVQARKRAEKQAYAEAQARKRAVLKQLREQGKAHEDE